MVVVRTSTETVSQLYTQSPVVGLHSVTRALAIIQYCVLPQ